MARTSMFADTLLTEFGYAFTTILDDATGSVICEGTVNMLRRILDFASLDIRSFYVTELEDGSVQADITVHAPGKEGMP